VESKREIRAAELSEDIRSGLSDVELMKKYGLSAKGLQSALNKLRLARKAKLGDFVQDIREGMTDAHLMEKYKITHDYLHERFAGLARKGLLSQEDIEKRMQPQDQAYKEPPSERLEPCHLQFLLPIREKDHPEIEGTVLEITDKGVGLRGIEARIDEVKTLVIPADEFSASPSVEFEARCCWVQPSEGRGGTRTGFEITAISEESSQWIREFIQLVTHGA